MIDRVCMEAENVFGDNKETFDGKIEENTRDVKSGEVMDPRNGRQKQFNCQSQIILAILSFSNSTKYPLMDYIINLSPSKTKMTTKFNIMTYASGGKDFRNWVFEWVQITGPRKHHHEAK